MKKKIGKTSAKQLQKEVIFNLNAANAREVHLVGEFNDWKPDAHPMHSDGTGNWKTTISLPEGQFQYKFLVDGHWVEDPENLRTCVNCFGTVNSIVNVAQ